MRIYWSFAVALEMAESSKEACSSGAEHTEEMEEEEEDFLPGHQTLHDYSKVQHG